MKDFGKVNSIYSEYFHDKSYPSRVAISVAELPKGALIEVDAMVAI
jgi:enamine deaminase RidA (YjgF/YER057c/UK114 family)